jgi:hypothetical protein
MLEGLAVEDVGLFYGHLVYFTAIWHLVYFMAIWVYLVQFFTLWYYVTRKIWQRWSTCRLLLKIKAVHKVLKKKKQVYL